MCVCVCVCVCVLCIVYCVLCNLIALCVTYQNYRNCDLKNIIINKIVEINFKVTFVLELEEE